MTPLLEQLSGSVSTARTLEDLTRPLLEMLSAVTGLESTYLTSIDEAQGTLRILHARNAGTLQIPEGLVTSWDQTPCKRALDEGLRYASDISSRWADLAVVRDLGLRAYASMPVRTADGRLCGTLCAASTRARPSTPETEHILTLFAHLIGQQIERERLIGELVCANERLARYAATDALTGLQNRRALIESLTRLLSQGRRRQVEVLVAFIDLDSFKSINDRHGHEVGDQFLVAIAQRLRAVLRGEDVVARMGGDEFVVAALGTHAGDTVACTQEPFRERVARATQGRFDLPDATLAYEGASLGAIAVPPEQPLTAEQALDRADRQMYEVKQARRLARQAPVRAGEEPAPGP